MAYTHVSKLTSKSDQLFETVEAWIDFHGSIGEAHELVADFAADLDEDGKTVIRTMIYDSEDDRTAHKSTAKSEDRLFIVELISEG